MRLDKYLSHLQVGSRKAVRELIRHKQVQVDGQDATDPGMAVTPAQQISVDGQALQGDYEVTWLMHKPSGVITATSDSHQRTVLDLIAPKDQRPGLFPVGRLDKDTTGLLLLTTDGNLGHTLLAPGKHVSKTYLVTLAIPLTPAMQVQLETGVVLGDFTSAPAQVQLVAETDDPQIQLTIHEGKFHQVKRMLHAVGNEVTALSRLTMGPLELPETLAPGQYRALTSKEQAALDALTKD